MSDFAFEKISAWVELIEKTNHKEVKKEELSKYIDLIGDGLIKFKLMDKLFPASQPEINHINIKDIKKQMKKHTGEKKGERND